MSMIFYQLVLFLVRPLVILRLWLRARSESEYGLRQSERFGLVPGSVQKGSVWFHTVSAGETIAAASLIRELKGIFPDIPFLVTTMTPAGSAQVQERLSDVVSHCYAPYDFGSAVDAFFATVEPRVLVLMETELWPNWVQRASSRNIPIMVVNARLSARSARGYGRLGNLVREMLGGIELFACQTVAHRDRFIGLGADPDRVIVSGSVKYDQTLPDDFSVRVNELRHQFGISEGESVWIAASTHPGEDEIVLTAHQLLRERIQNLRLILVPRHPVRVDAVAMLCQSAGFVVGKQSETSLQQDIDIVLGDVMGTLLYLYGLADVAFLGGSFEEIGGHNPIEPALCQIPVVSGPHQYNFTDVMETMSQAGGLVTVTDAQELARVAADWLGNDEIRSQAGRSIAKVVTANRGAQEKVRELVGTRIAATILE